LLLSPGIALDFTREFCPHFSEKRNYVVPCIYWFGTDTKTIIHLSGGE